MIGLNQKVKKFHLYHMDENEQFTMEIPVMFVYFDKKDPNFK